MGKNYAFDEAAERLLGMALYSRLHKMHCPMTGMCKEVALGAFLGTLEDYPGKDADQELIRHVARTLLDENGCIGLPTGNGAQSIVNYVMPEQIIIYERGTENDGSDTFFYLRVEKLGGDIKLVELKSCTDPLAARKKAESSGYSPTHYMAHNGSAPIAYQ